MSITLFEILLALWQTIREGDVELHKKGYIEQVSDPTNNSFYDIVFRTFYKNGWSKEQPKLSFSGM